MQCKINAVNKFPNNNRSSQSKMSIAPKKQIHIANTTFIVNEHNATEMRT